MTPAESLALFAYLSFRKVEIGYRGRPLPLEPR